MALRFVLLPNRLLKCLLFRGRPLLARRLHLVALYSSQHACSLFAAHHRDSRIRPLKQKSRRVGAPAHRVVTRAVAATDDYTELRHVRTSNRGHQLGAVLSNAAGLSAATHH